EKATARTGWVCPRKVNRSRPVPASHTLTSWTVCFGAAGGPAGIGPRPGARTGAGGASGGSTPRARGGARRVAAGREGRAGARPLVPGERPQRRAGDGVPDLHRPVATAAGDALAVGTVGDTGNAVGVAEEGALAARYQTA